MDSPKTVLQTAINQPFIKSSFFIFSGVPFPALASNKVFQAVERFGQVVRLPAEYSPFGFVYAPEIEIKGSLQSFRD